MKAFQYDHMKELPGSPTLPDIFWHAWLEAIARSPRPVEFVVNGFRIRIEREK